MRLLDRYLLREFLLPLAYCLAGFFLFWVSFDLFSELDEFQRQGLRVNEIALLYLVRTPELLVTVLPVALLLGLLYSLTNHARHHELTAMRAAGVGLWRLCVPYLAVGLLFSLALFTLNEFCVPDANEAANQILDRHRAGQSQDLSPDWRKNLAFHNERDRRIWNISAYNRVTTEMIGPNVEWPRADGSRRRIVADRAIFTNSTWTFFEVKEIVYAGVSPTKAPNRGAETNQGSAVVDPMIERFRNITRSQTNQLAVPELTETPEQINSEIKFSELSNLRAAKRPRLSLREILNYQRLHPFLNAADSAKLETQFQGRLAEPWTCLVVVLIAIPFGAPSGRRNVFVGVASSIFIGFTYFIILRFGLALGTGGYLAPWLAAWAPNIFFALTGAVLAHRVR